MTRTSPTNPMARPIAPEDLRRGTYVAALEMIWQHLPGCAPDAALSRSPQPVKTAWIPCDGNDPMKVLDVCLPFACVRHANGRVGTIDVRRFHLARLDEAYARRVVKRLRADRADREERAKRRRRPR